MIAKIQRTKTRRRTLCSLAMAASTVAMLSACAGAAESGPASADPTTLAVSPRDSAAPGPEAPAPGSPASGVVTPTDPSKPGAGMVAVEVLNLMELEDGYLVLLAERGKAAQVLPMGIGACEAVAIHRRISGVTYPRPLTHDLIETILDTQKLRVARLEIQSLERGAFIGRLYLVDPDGAILDLDVRPSDGLALALGDKAPVFAARRVLDEAGIDPDELGPSNSGGPK